MSDRPSTLLIVDDEVWARQTVEMLLLPEGYQLLLAEDGEQMLDLLQTHTPDTILLDVMMPGRDGFELCELLKSSPEWQHIPIILVTALDSSDDLARGLHAGADDFITKPVNSLELRARVRSMLRIKARHDTLQSMMQLRDELSHMIIHDIRSPLTTIEVFCDLLEEEVASEDGVYYLAAVRRQSRRLSAFATDMLLTAKMEQNRLLLNKTPTDIGELLDMVFDTYQPLAESRNLTLQFEITPPSAVLEIDEMLWQRLLDNLLTNALKFSPSGGVVTLCAHINPTAEQKLCLTVCDEGPGIAPEHREAIFNRYQVAAAGNHGVTQVGLGLAFCKLVVEAHGGTIDVLDNRPRGAIFRITL